MGRPYVSAWFGFNSGKRSIKPSGKTTLVISALPSFKIPPPIFSQGLCRGEDYRGKPQGDALCMLDALYSTRPLLAVNSVLKVTSKLIWRALLG